MQQCFRNIKYCFGESAMSKIKICEWYKRFQEGCEDIKDDERPGSTIAGGSVKKDQSNGLVPGREIIPKGEIA